MERIRGLDAGQRPALVISECQRGMTDPAVTINPGLSGQVHERGIVGKIAALAGVCRANDIPVIHCPVVLREDLKGLTICCVLTAQMAKSRALCKGRPEAEIHPLLSPQQGDFVVERIHGVSAFHGTELEAILRALRIDTLILTGVSTNIALPGICTEAVNRGFNVVMPEDCTAGGTAETHQMQVTMHLPLLATISAASSVTTMLAQRSR
jgi:nicotinamidase-related amidase